jgi:hypothetical protein
MKKILLSVALVGTILMSSCGGGTAMTESQVTAMVDSIAGEKNNEASAKATAECEARMTTEIKTMSDSLIANKK